jgi:hypothetical protein
MVCSLEKEIEQFEEKILRDYKVELIIAYMGGVFGKKAKSSSKNDGMNK